VRITGKSGLPATLDPWKTFRLNGVPFTVGGITPHNFVGTNVDAPDFWLPLSAEPLIHPASNWVRDRENACCRLFARLAPGATMAQAQAEMSAVADHLRGLHAKDSDLAKPVTAMVWPGSPFPMPLDHFHGLNYVLMLILGSVGLVLVIACANVACLQLARAASRHNELTMRLSLGAGRVRLIRQLLTESALLSVVAGAVALLFSWAFLQLIVVITANAFPSEYGTFVFHVTPDLGIFAYVFCLSLVAGVLFDLAPALESSGAALSSALKANAGTSPARSRRLRNTLIAVQVSFSLMLLVAGSMLIRGSIRALTMETGYDSKHGLELELQFPEGGSYSEASKNALVRELRTHLASIAGVAGITTANAPDGGGLRTAAISLNGEKPSAKNTQAVLFYKYIQADYFQTLEIPLLFGRAFQAQAGDPEPVVILSDSAARQVWPGQNPIGRSLRMGTDGQFHTKEQLVPDGKAYEVIGVARDTRGVLMDGSDSQVVYVPLPENRLQDYPILIHTHADPAQCLEAIGSVLASGTPMWLSPRPRLSSCCSRLRPSRSLACLPSSPPASACWAWSLLPWASMALSAIWLFCARARWVFAWHSAQPGATCCCSCCVRARARFSRGFLPVCSWPWAPRIFCIRFSTGSARSMESHSEVSRCSF